MGELSHKITGSPPPLKVVTSCRGRFHIFDQARELARHGVLHRLVADYPVSYAERFGVPAAKVHALVLQGMLNHGYVKARRYLPSAWRDKTDELIHNNFSRRLAACVPDDTDYFIGLSSFSLEALYDCRDRGIRSAVEHGSLHLEASEEVVREEARRWGVRGPLDIPAPWLIDKENREFEAADHVHLLSSAARESFLRHGVPAHKIVVNPCGVDLSAFCPGRKRDDVFRVIQVGGVNLRKGVLTALSAFADFKAPDAQLWFVGGTLEGSGVEEAAGKFLSPRVSFVKPVPQFELNDFYQQSSVFVLASLEDGFGMVVAQAMACGLPVIVTENVGARDLIQDGVNGFVVPVGAPEAITDRMRYFYEQPERRREMGAMARRTIESGYGWSDYGDRLVASIRALVQT
ncbi:MAG: glycosyltransferase family 1 protein [Proteobacteria bacterium]|nr:MAG: glycosyltransferase family 1 protein [Pseudomonadota bacterium]